MMCNIFKNSISLFLVVLELLSAEAKHDCTDPANCATKATFQDLRLICNLGGNIDANINKMPDECTAVAQFSSNQELLQRVNQIRGKLPLMVITDTSTTTTTTTNNVQSVGKDQSQFGGVAYDYIAFDMFAAIQTDPAPPDATKALVDWFTSFAVKNGVFVGLFIRNDINWLNTKKINFGLINKVVDFYVFQSTDYKKCEYVDGLKAKADLTSAANVAESIEALKGMGMDLKTLIITVDLKMQSTKANQTGAVDLSYSKFCQTLLISEHTFCYNTILSLYDRAKLRITDNLAGILAQDIDYDDFNGTCTCKTKDDTSFLYRGLKTLSGASQENENDLNYYYCSSGSYPLFNSTA